MILGQVGKYIAVTMVFLGNLFPVSLSIGQQTSVPKASSATSQEWNTTKNGKELEYTEDFSILTLKGSRFFPLPPALVKLTITRRTPLFESAGSSGGGRPTRSTYSFASQGALPSLL